MSSGTVQSGPPYETCEQFTKSLLDKFLTSRATNSSPKTIEIYHLALDRFIGYPLSPEGINQYLKSLNCGNAKYNYYRCIKTLCNWLYQNNLTKDNPIRKVIPPRREQKLLPAISQEQLEVLINYCHCERDRVLISFLWHSGVRISEAINVKSSDFDWNEGTVIVRGKAGRYRKALAGNGLVRQWFSEHSSFEITKDGAQTMLKRLSKEIGMKFSAHSFRRGFAVHIVKSGLSTRIVQALGGWSTITMVAHYTKNLSFDDALRGYQSLSNNKQ